MLGRDSYPSDEAAWGAFHASQRTFMQWKAKLAPIMRERDASVYMLVIAIYVALQTAQAHSSTGVTVRILPDSMMALCTTTFMFGRSVEAAQQAQSPYCPERLGACLAPIAWHRRTLCTRGREPTRDTAWTNGPMDSPTYRGLSNLI